MNFKFLFKQSCLPPEIEKLYEMHQRLLYGTIITTTIIISRSCIDDDDGGGVVKKN